MVTSSISRSDLLAQSFKGAHRVGCACVHRGECTHMYINACVCTVFLKKNIGKTQQYNIFKLANISQIHTCHEYNNKGCLSIMLPQD
jgi:hypothetical protein